MRLQTKIVYFSPLFASRTSPSLQYRPGSVALTTTTTPKTGLVAVEYGGDDDRRDVVITITNNIITKHYRYASVCYLESGDVDFVIVVVVAVLATVVPGTACVCGLTQIGSRSASSACRNIRSLISIPPSSAGLAMLRAI